MVTDSNNSNLSLGKDTVNWTSRRVDNIVDQLVHAHHVPIPERIDAAVSARDRLDSFLGSLHEAHDFEIVQTPLLQINDDSGELTQMLDDGRFDEFADYFRSQNLEIKGISKGVEKYLTQFVNDNWHDDEKLGFLSELLEELNLVGSNGLAIDSQAVEDLFAQSEFTDLDKARFSLIPQVEIYKKLTALSKNQNDVELNNTNAAEFRRIFAVVDGSNLAKAVMQMFVTAKAKPSLNPVLREYFEFKVEPTSA